MTKSVVLIAQLDSGIPGPEHFQIVESEVSPLDGEGSIQVQLTAISADPFLRGRIKSNTNGNVGIGAGEPIVGFVVGKVVKSNGNAIWSVGDLFGASLPFTTVQNLTTAQLSRTLIWKLTDLVSELELDLGLGVLGMPGSTAYGGLIDVLRPKEGDTIFVSAASGAVGSLVGMLAKNVYNCKTIGSCGGAEKVALIKDKFGYDHAIDYKTIDNKEQLKEALKVAAPGGIDMYFENVGGMHFEAAFESLRARGRIAVCGGISTYNDATSAPVQINPLAMIYSHQRIEGFVCAEWLTGRRGNFLQDMHRYLREGKVVAQETVFEGIDKFGEAFQSLFTGKNLGKVVIHV